MPTPLLVFLTPIFGLSLHLDPQAVVPSPVVAQIEAQLEAADAATADDHGDDPAPDPTVGVDTPSDSPDSASPTEPTMVSPTAEPAAPTPAEVAEANPEEAAGSSVADALARRRRMARVHRAMGLTTFGTMTLAVIFGTIQYYNLYGVFDPLESAPCTRGAAIGSQSSCVGTPTLHLVTAALTTASYATTFGLSYAMPDPIGLDRGNSDSARRLRRHKRLRWAHFGGMIAQGLLGALAANGRAVGLDRTNDYRTLQAIATVHLITGYTTYGLLTWSGATMLRR